MKKEAFFYAIFYANSTAFYVEKSASESAVFYALYPKGYKGRRKLLRAFPRP
jgi:hypothetical protein